MKRIIIFASGSGSNAENIISYFETKPNISVDLVLTNKTNAGVIKRCNALGVSALYFNRVAFYTADIVLRLLKDRKPDLIVLAGFLWKFPEHLLDIFPNKVINIHPALLPKYGGKGMYGKHVHQAVVDNKEDQTGITIHYVNENYDEGQIIFQKHCQVLATDTAEDVANKIHGLEMAYFPKVIETLLNEQKN